MKNMGIILFGVIVGSAFCFIIFGVKKENVLDVINEQNELSFFQLGIFKNLDYAKELKEENKGSIIVKDDNYYYVYSAILLSENNIYRLKDYYDQNKVNYYIKKMNVDSNYLINEVIKYDSLMEKFEMKAILEINNQILNIYRKEYPNNVY